MSGDIRWRCRRGMRELDALLAHFVEHQHGNLSDDLKDRFRIWLDLSDPVLWERISGPLPEDALDFELANLLRRFPGFRPQTN